MNFVLGLVPKALYWLAGKADDNPKKAASGTLLSSLAVILGIKPETVHPLGEFLMVFGDWLSRF